ncbi:uncharacterized protein EHS24_006238 [Apiotrichum porosum]|uniref:Uncharacterized protein n=1 Tax=Apiotrichum porosum TaxID=105984 RepID=A0A427Y0N1_9TREE|nr:uncharacterized protein EHS24_006238 [Apiotrichum porosum]RSH84714.1 hypothetical protein EHS24_006238 [Apiotrichum porosum]
MPTGRWLLERESQGTTPPPTGFVHLLTLFCCNGWRRMSKAKRAQQAEDFGVVGTSSRRTSERRSMDVGQGRPPAPPSSPAPRVH